MPVGMTEFLDKVSKLKRTQEKVDALRYNDSFELRMIMQAAFDPNVKWALPDGHPPYKPNDVVDQQHVLLQEIRKLPYFIEGFHPEVDPRKKEMMWVELLERVDPEDAKLLCAIKDKKLPMKGITIDHVTEALPGIIPNEQGPNQEVPQI